MDRAAARQRVKSLQWAIYHCCQLRAHNHNRSGASLMTHGFEYYKTDQNRYHSDDLLPHILSHFIRGCDYVASGMVWIDRNNDWYRSIREVLTDASRLKAARMAFGEHLCRLVASLIGESPKFELQTDGSIRIFLS